jgi:hypothetical protein
VTVSINQLLQAIQFAVIEAQEVAEEQHMRQMAEYFTDDGAPVTIPLQLPNPQWDGKTEAEQYVDVDVPKITLVPQNSVTIKELEVEMEVPIGNLNVDEDDLPKEISTEEKEDEEDLPTSVVHKRLARRRWKRRGIAGPKQSLSVNGKGSFFGGSNKKTAKIRIKFEGGEPPEVVARIEQSLVKGVET